jgi:hypothetical protein
MRLYSNQEILESWINGQKKQCAKQYLSLDSDERKDFSIYCQEVYEYEDYIRILEYAIEYTLKDLRDNYVLKDIYEY